MTLICKQSVFRVLQRTVGMKLSQSTSFQRLHTGHCSKMNFKIPYNVSLTSANSCASSSTIRSLSIVAVKYTSHPGNSSSEVNASSEINTLGTFNQLESPPLTQEQRIILAKSEYELLKEEAHDELSSNISDEHWLELAECKSFYSRKKYHRYLFLTEMKILNDRKKKESARAVANEIYLNKTEERLNNKHINYGLWNNTMFLKFSNAKMANVENHKLVRANQLGQPLVFDNSYDSKMTRRSKKDLVRQLQMGFSHNRSQDEPFYLHMCNFKEEEETSQLLNKGIPSLLDEDYLVDRHEGSYLDVFPHDKLVYLSPHCEDVLEEFDHDAVYIVGNLVDRGTAEPLSVAKAKKENIKMQKFPLETYLEWGTGCKSLTINQVMGILHELKRTGSWVQALGMHIPRRKLVKKNLDAAAIKAAMTKDGTARGEL